MSFLNGRLPSAALGKIHNGRLRRDAARAWNAMNMESRGRFGVTLRPTGSMSSYRTYAQQVYLRKLYLSGRGNLAAVPGTSNHGEGLAVDLATLRMRQIVDEIGAKYGWSKRWSDAPREWWHIKWRSGVWNKKAPYGPRILTKGSRGRDVLKLKSLMYGKGLRNFDRFTPIFGDGVKAALIRYQKKHDGMTPDGVAGPKTWHRLLS